MPPIGLILGGVDFSDLAVTLKAAEGATPAVVIAYGKFIQTIIDFLIISFAIFMGLKAINTLKKKQEEEAAAPAGPTKDQELLTEIRDLLKSQQER
jgi:large conductance mechanosensitive channel